MKYKIKTKDCSLTVTVKLASCEEIDERALGGFSALNLRGFLRPTLIKKNQIEYSGPVGITLSEHLKQPMTKHEFFFIVEQIIVAAQKIHANRLLMNQLLLDPAYTFINVATKELQFLYIPIKTVIESRGIIGFLDTIASQVCPSHEADKSYAMRFISFVKSQRGFDPVAIEQFIAKEDKNVVQAIKRQNAGQSGFMTGSKQHRFNRNGAEASSQIPAVAVPAQSRSVQAAPVPHATQAPPSPVYAPRPVFSSPERPVFAPSEDDLPTGLLNENMNANIGSNVNSFSDEPDGNETALLIEPGVDKAVVRYPRLTRVRTGEMVQVNKPVFRLGKERSYVDYFISNNNAVSRSHADVITRGNKCFITDLNSKNRTFINNQPIPIQCEVEIRNGDRLKLGNEEFVFHF